MRHLAPPTGLRLVPFHAALLALALSSHGSALAFPLSGGAGLDRQAGPGDHTFTAALVFGAASFGGVDATLAAIRYDDSVTGDGSALFANAGVPVPGLAKLRVIGSRSFGDSGYRAWKLRAGPEWPIHVLALGIYGLHQEDNAGSRLNAAGAELGVPLGPNVTSQVGCLIGRREGGTASSQASGGVVWAALPHVQLIGEIDFGRSVISTTSSTSGGGPLQALPVGGLGAGRSGETTTTQMETVGLLGVRFTIP